LEQANLIKTILVVEDEADLLVIIAQILRRSGYEVLEALSAVDASFICRHTDIDLILSDFNLPGMNGIALAHEIDPIRPKLPIIFMTGNREACDEITARGFYCLKKPFSFADMEYIIRETLGAPQST